MAAKLDWSEIQSADYGYSNPSSFTLSLEGVKLLLVLLDARAVFRGAWKVGGNPPTDSEWDDIQEFVSGVSDALFKGGKMIAILEDQKTAGVHGGTFTLGAWRIRDLNTIVHNDLGLTLASNEFTLPPTGKYLISARCPFYNTIRSQARIYNVSDAIVVKNGQNAFLQLPNVSTAFVETVVDISVSTTFRIEHQGQLTVATYGFGIELNSFFTVPYEVYTQVTIHKL